MYAERIELQFDVRINCELSREVDSYQIVYVERNENNRTILAQGISAPLERIADFQQGGGDSAMGMEETMIRKWMIPSNGGPVYDETGLRAYDVNPDVDNEQNRVVTNRKSFYFDSPDFVYNKISSNFVESCVLEYIETIATDHDRHNIIGGYNRETCGWGGQNGDAGNAGNPGTQCYFANGTKNDAGPAPFGGPKFSQKIPSSLLSGSEKTRPFWVNTSVFANRLRERTYTSFQNEITSGYKYPIFKAQSASPGEILSGYKMNDKFDYANHAFTLAAPGWFFQQRARQDSYIDTASLFRVHNIAGGRETILIKTDRNFFSTENISQTPYIINSQVNFGTSGGRRDVLKGHDAYIVSNLKRNNEDSIYGGRTEFAYSANEYIPLSDVIPVISNRITSQIFYVEGDSYCNLYLRNKTSYQNTEVPTQIGFHWSQNSIAGDRKYQYNKFNAWCYAVVLESTVESRLNNSEEFYKFSKAINFDYEELYNSAYLQENDLKKSIPIPYNFKDDPILNNIIAASNVKLSGDYIDAWTQFDVNEFYEVDKNMGSALNIVKYKDEIYVIQEKQTSKILIDEQNFIAQSEIEKQQNEIKRQQELADAEQTGADISLINAKYAKIADDIEKTKQDNKLTLASNAFGSLASIFGAESKAGKAAAIAQTTIDTYKGAVAAYASLAEIPIVGPALGGIAAAAAVASGLKAVKQITATKSPEIKRPNYASGVIGLRGSGSGTSDDVSANLSVGESVINARSTSMFANELAAINQAGGGVGLNGASNILNQNDLNNNANNSQLVSMIAEAVAVGAEKGTSKGSQSGIKELSNDRKVMADAKF